MQRADMAPWSSVCRRPLRAPLRSPATATGGMIAHTPVALKRPTAMIGDIIVDMIVVVVGGAGDADWAHLRQDTSEVARVRRGDTYARGGETDVEACVGPGSCGRDRRHAGDEQRRNGGDELTRSYLGRRGCERWRPRRRGARDRVRQQGPAHHPVGVGPICEGGMSRLASEHTYLTRPMPHCPCRMPDVSDGFTDISA